MRTLAMVVALLSGVLTIAPASAYAASNVSASGSGSGTVVTDRIISTDTTWGAEGSPYLVSGTVQVAAGATLTVAPGAEVIVDKTIELVGGLSLIGTRSTPVTVQTDVPLFRGIGDYRSPSRRVVIDHADVTGPGALTAPNTKYLALQLTDSTLTDIVQNSFLWYPTELLIERNVFTAVNTIEVGTSEQAAVIRNNRFRVAPSSGFSGYDGQAQLVSWAAYGGDMLVTGNVFEESVRPRILEVNIDGRMDAPGNYFGSVNEAEVKGWVQDADDDLNRKDVVSVTPLLHEPPSEVPIAAPTAPRDVQASKDNGATRVTWSTPASNGGAARSGYSVTATPDDFRAGPPRTITTAPNATETSIDALLNGTTYVISVTAKNSAGSSPAAITSITPVAEPVAPAAPRATNQSGSIRVDWDAPLDDGGSPVNGYRVTATPGDHHRYTDGAARSVVFDELPKGVRHTFTVQATNSLGDGPQSPPSTATAGFSAPDAVTSPNLVRGNGAIDVTWSAPSDNGSPIVHYRVELSPGRHSLNVPASSRSVRFSGLSNGTRYTATVSALNSAGYGPIGPASNAATPAARPGVASKLKAAVSGRRVTLRWARAPHNGEAISRYVILMNNKRVGSTRGDVRKFVIRKAPKGRPLLRVRAANAVGQGPLSPALRVRVR